MSTNNKRVPKLYISHIRQPDGSWTWDEEPRTLRETNRLATFNRIIGGLTTQVWPQSEALQHMADEASQSND